MAKALTVRFRVDFGDRCSVGVGKIELLEGIARTGSLSQAAREMRMSYRRAWLLLQDIESVMGAAAIAGESGGARGGGSTLTPLGRAVVDRYRAIEAQASRSVAAQLRALSKLAGAASAPPASTTARKRSLPKARRVANIKS